MPESKQSSLELFRKPAHARSERRLAGRVRIPISALDLDQDEEWFELEQEDGSRRRIRFHDYGEIYQVPGLYEELFHEHLLCCSPARVRAMLADALEDLGKGARDLRLLDVGAGNGMVGEELRSLGIPTVVGVDILEEARDAALRDRKSVYDAYFAVDLTELPSDVAGELLARRFNCMSCVAALGFGDIPVEAFLRALELIDVPGLVVFNIKEDFLQGTDSSGFDRVVRDLIQHGVLRVESYRRYRHRMSVSGEPLHYAAVVASKLSSVKGWLAAGGMPEDGAAALRDQDAPHAGLFTA